MYKIIYDPFNEEACVPDGLIDTVAEAISEDINYCLGQMIDGKSVVSSKLILSAISNLADRGMVNLGEVQILSDGENGCYLTFAQNSLKGIAK